MKKFYELKIIQRKIKFIRKLFTILFVILFTIQCSFFQKEQFISILDGIESTDEYGNFEEKIPFGTKVKIIKEEKDTGKLFISLPSEKKVWIKDGLLLNHIPNQIFVKSLMGVSYPEGKILYKTKLLLKNYQIEKETTNLLIEYDGKEYWISPKGLSLTEPNLHFSITTNSGLNLREGPGQSFKTITTLPYGSVGKILKIKPELEYIQKRYGFWLFTENNNLKGWLFSGFVVIQDTNTSSSNFVEENQQDFSGDDYVFKEAEFFEEELKQGIIHNHFNFQDFKIDFMKAKDPNEFDTNCGYDKFISIESKGKANRILGGAFNYQHIKTTEFGFIFYESNGCGCCCAPFINTILALGNDKIYSMNFTNSQFASCDTIEMNFLNVLSSQEFRIDVETKTLLLLREIPICDQGTIENEELDREKIYQQLGSKYYFYSFELKTDSLIQEKLETKTKQIPEKWKVFWDRSKPLSSFN
jgi:hypothetical protein